MRIVAGIVLSVLALAGCGGLADLGQLQEDLEAAGYDSTSVNHDTTDGHSLLVIEASRDAEVTEEDAGEVAELAWTTFPGEIDELEVHLNGELAVQADAAELTDRFGERPDGLGEDSGTPTVVAIAVVAGIAVVLAAILVLVWRRGRRPPRGVPPTPHPSQYPLYPGS